MESQARNASDLEIDDDFPHSPISFEDFNNNMSNIQLMNHSPGSNYSSLLVRIHLYELSGFKFIYFSRRIHPKHLINSLGMEQILF